MRVQKDLTHENCPEEYCEIMEGIENSKEDIENFLEFIEEDYGAIIQLNDKKQR